MGNKFRFILDYYDYIDNIEKLSVNDDINIFNSFKNQTKNGSLVLTEGLIKTHPIEKSINIIKKRFPYLNISIEDDGELYIDNFKKQLKEYIPLFNNLGYFIDHLKIDNDTWTKKINDDIIPSALYLEAKYDIKIDKIPNKLYHASPLKFKDKILKYGFIPKSKNKISIHPDRIYLTDDILTAKLFAKNLEKEYSEYYKDGYCIYSIDGKCIKELYSDVNLRKGGYYVLHNIHPKCFKIVFEGKF